RPVDLLVDCTGKIVVNGVHIGVGADAGRDSATWKRWLGRIGYPIAALLAGFKARGIHLCVEVDDEIIVDLDRPVHQVAIGNGPNVGGGTKLTPDASPEDGFANVIVWFATGPWAKIGYMLHLRRGLHHHRYDVSATRAQTVRVTGQKFYCNADGEVYGPETRRQWRIEPKAFQMILRR
ncbi:MAG: diacylglycerol kinase, partial [Actinomycetota bacterium]|nr:diacylglycerol kinase [Actinomycetota bacterium]